MPKVRVWISMDVDLLARVRDAVGSGSLSEWMESAADTKLRSTGRLRDLKVASRNSERVARSAETRT